MGNLKKCEYCGSSVSARRMGRHVSTVHPDAEGPRGNNAEAIQLEFRRAKARKEKAREGARKASASRSAGMKVAKAIAAVALVSVVIGVAYFLVSQPTAKTGQPAPNFEVFDTDGYPFRVADEKGKPIVIYFMRGTWCPTCKASMPALLKAWETYKARGLVMVSIDLDASEYVSDLKAYKVSYGAAWSFALDTANAGALYGAQSTVGMKFYIFKDGTIEGSGGGIASFDEMRPHLDRIVGG